MGIEVGDKVIIRGSKYTTTKDRCGIVVEITGAYYGVVIDNGITWGIGKYMSDWGEPVLVTQDTCIKCPNRFKCWTE